MTQPQEQQGPPPPRPFASGTAHRHRVVTLYHNHGDPIRTLRPEDPEQRRALAKQRKKLMRLLLKARAKLLPFPIPVQPQEPINVQDETNRPDSRESPDLNGPGAKSQA
jgi:hypothetical protein